MAKRRVLDDVEIFYVKKNPDKLSVAQLSEKFNVSDATIERILEEERASQKKPQTPMSSLLEAGRKRRNGKVVASVMVPQASQLGDAIRPKGDPLDRLKNCVHKPMGD
jgi:hypothetical protein